MTEPQGGPEMENIRLRLLKVLRLAQSGVGGEKENAESLLAKLLRKHSLTLADLEGDFVQGRTRVWLTAVDRDERTVLSQLVIRLLGLERTLWHSADAFNLGVDASPAERAAIVVAWDVYREAFADARHALIMGFCFKHGLYAAEGGEPEVSAEGRARAARALSIADALPTVDPPGKRLGSGDGERPVRTAE